MGDDQHPSDHAQTLVKFSLSIAPASSADDRVTGLLSNLFFDLATLVGCSRKTAAHTTILCTEETSATLEENMFSSGELKVDLAIVGEKVLVHSAVRPTEVEIPGTESWFQPDEPQRDIGKAPSKTIESWFQPDEPQRDIGKAPSKTIRRKRSDLLAQTVEERRVDRTQGGLGLMRLTAESKFKLGSEDDKGDKGKGGGSEGEGGSSAPAATVVPLRKGPS